MQRKAQVSKLFRVLEQNVKIDSGYGAKVCIVLQVSGCPREYSERLGSSLVTQRKHPSLSLSFSCCHYFHLQKASWDWVHTGKLGFLSEMQGGIKTKKMHGLLTTGRYHFSPIWMTIIQRKEKKCWQACGETGTLCNAVWNAKWNENFFKK